MMASYMAFLGSGVGHQPSIIRLHQGLGVSSKSNEENAWFAHKKQVHHIRLNGCT